jgi:membrane protease YdiL (CAAX protease family)
MKVGNTEPREDALLRRRRVTLAFVSVATWLLAASVTGRFGIWPSLGGAAVVLGVAVLWLDPASTTLLRPSLRLIVLGAVLGGAMVVATYVLYPPVARMVPCIATDTARLYAAFRAPSLVVASLALAPVIIGEELVWRGVVQTSVVEPFQAVVSTALLYALVHVPLGSPVLVAAAFFCGLVWGALRAATASLVPTLVAHLLWDALVLLWVPLDR